jgi:hypothetical protein
VRGGRVCSIVVVDQRDMRLFLAQRKECRASPRDPTWYAPQLLLLGLLGQSPASCSVQDPSESGTEPSNDDSEASNLTEIPRTADHTQALRESEPAGHTRLVLCGGAMASGSAVAWNHAYPSGSSPPVHTTSPPWSRRLRSGDDPAAREGRGSC